MDAVLTPPPDLYERTGDDRLLMHFHPGQKRAWESAARFVAVLAGSQSGKALALDTPIPTPNGFVPMGEVRDGDEVLDETGAPCRVLKAHAAYLPAECFRVVFDDGAVIIADAEHLWQTSTCRERKNAARRRPTNDRADRPQCSPGPTSGVRTTREVLETVRDPRGGNNHAVRLAGPAQFRERPLPVDPYTLGVWLGDGTKGTSNVTSADPDVLTAVAAGGYSVGPPRESNSGLARTYSVGMTGVRGGRTSERVNPFLTGLRGLGVLTEKHVPAAYLTASPAQRLALLRGLMDTDGWCEKYGECGFANGVKALTDAVDHLAKSLGLKTRRRVKPTESGRPSYVVSFYAKFPVFRLTRKADRQAAWKRRALGNSQCDYRYVVAVEPTDPVPVRCLTVDSTNCLYLAGESFIPTHNTSWGPWWLLREIYGFEDSPLGGRGPGDYIAATATYDLFKLKMLPAIREVFEGLCGLGRYWPGAKVLELRPNPDVPFRAKRADDPMWGRIILRSAEGRGGLESSTAKGAWLDEAGQDSFRAETWEAVQSRLALAMGRCLLSSTLYNFGWLKTQVHDRWKAGDRDYDVVHFDSVANPRFSRKEWDRAKASMPGWKFAMRYQGRYERPAGMIYDCFEDSYYPDGHLVRRFDVPWSWPRHLGLDFGGVHTAGAFFAEDPAAKVLYWYRQYLAGDLTAADHVAALRAGEPADIAAVGGSWSEGQWRDEFAAGGLYVERPDVSEVEIGISRLYGALKTRKLLIFDDLVGGYDDPTGGSLGELRSYARKLDALGEPTEVILNKSQYHRLDAARYAAANVFAPDAGTPSLRAGRNPLAGFNGRRGSSARGRR